MNSINNSNGIVLQKNHRQ